MEQEASVDGLLERLVLAQRGAARRRRGPRLALLFIRRLLFDCASANRCVFRSVLPVSALVLLVVLAPLSRRVTDSSSWR